MLEVEHLAFSYTPARRIIEDVSFTLREGESLCVLGPNGCGKTTMLRCLLALNKPSAGSVRVDGVEMARIPAKERARRIAYVPQSTDMAFPYQAREVALMGRTSSLRGAAAYTREDRALVDETFERLEIDYLATRQFKELSGGERQMVLVARAVVQQARILVMDEPTANLDYGNQIKVLKTIRNLVGDGFGVLMTSHYPDHAFLVSEKVLMLKDGRVEAEGRPDEVVTETSLTELYHAPVAIGSITARTREVKVCVPILDE